MTDEDTRPERHALLELDALLRRIELFVDEGDRERFDVEEPYRWVLHRLWIAVGNEALTYARVAGRNPYTEQPWARLYRLRNTLAHQRLPDIDEDEVWRACVLRPAEVRDQVRVLLR